MPDPLDAIALVYDDDAFREVTQQQRAGEKQKGPMGLMGRQVAGKEFLDALLDQGRWPALVALVGNPAGAASVEAYWKTHWAGTGAPTRKQLRVLDWIKGWESFLGKAPP